jgi:hypothetical protein
MTTPAIEALECRRLFAAAITYTLIELTFEPMDLNNLDQIAAADNVYQIRKGGRLEATALPTLVSNGRVVANRINDNGTMIGLETVGQLTGDDLTLREPVVVARDSHGHYQTRSLRADRTNPIDPTNLMAINDNDEILTDGGEDPNAVGVVGNELLISLGPRGRVSGTNVNDILPAGESLRFDLPADLNNQGQAVGQGVGNFIDVYYEFHNGRGSIAPATALSGDAVSDVQKLTAINDSGVIVGNTALATSGRNTEATIYQRSSRGRYYRTFLGHLPDDTDSLATAINNAGQVVGESFAKPQFEPVTDESAFILQPGSSAISDLNALIENPGKDRVNRPISINDAGLIIAEAFSTRNGRQRFVLLLPSKSTGGVSRSIESEPVIAPPAVTFLHARRDDGDGVWQGE